MGKQIPMSVLSVVTMLLSLAAAAALSSPATNDITCADGIKMLMPCQLFLRGVGPPMPSLQCCEGASDVYHLANTTDIRRSLCECFKTAAVKLGILTDKAKKIPELCHIPLGVPIDPTVDCTKIPV